MPMTQRNTPGGGFTFVEVIAVLVILTIVSALVVSRSGSFSNDLVSQTDILKTHLRYAQNLAMAGTGPAGIHGIKWNSDYYWLFKGVDPDAGVVWLPGDRRYDTTDDDKLDLSAKNIDISTGAGATTYALFFDDRGIPYSAYTDENVNTPLPSDLSITVTPRGAAGPTETITVTQLTGFIP